MKDYDRPSLYSIGSCCVHFSCVRLSVLLCASSYLLSHCGDLQYFQRTFFPDSLWHFFCFVEPLVCFPPHSPVGCTCMSPPTNPRIPSTSHSCSLLGDSNSPTQPMLQSARASVNRCWALPHTAAFTATTLKYFDAFRVYSMKITRMASLLILLVVIFLVNKNMYSFSYAWPSKLILFDLKKIELLPILQLCSAVFFHYLVTDVNQIHTIIIVIRTVIASKFVH